jgi:type II secretory pathway pseudopilin PulG
MRRLVDIAAVFLVAAVAAGVFYLRLEQQRDQAVERAVLADVQRFQQEVQKRAATGQSTTNNARGWPITIEPEWFDGSPPQNPLLSSDRPWVEVAPPEQAYLLHPEVRIATDTGMAAFWYNPYQGLVRTRVPATMSDQRALELYNRLNQCALASIFQTEPAPKSASVPSPVPPPAEAPAAADDGAEDGSAKSASADDSGGR